MTFSPIILFCYQRTDTLKLCIESLQKCPEIKNTDLLIISDAPANDSVKNKVIEVRKFIHEILGFKSIEIIERTTNLGVDYNIITGLKEASDRFDRFIIIEDDIIVKPDFLTYLNTALDFYLHNTNVFGISAFTFLNTRINNYNYDACFAGRLYPWGWATWSNRINQIDWEIQDKTKFLNSNKLQKEFNNWGSDMSPMLKNTFSGRIRAWDIRLDYHIFKYKKFILYPMYTFSENIGFGRNDSSNTTGYNRYKVKLNSKLINDFSLPPEVIINDIINKKFRNKNSLQQRVFTKLMKFIGYKN